MSHQTILFDRADAVGIVRLNRPERMNAVVEEMYRDLQAVLESARRDAGIRVLILTGSVRKSNVGDKQAFCAGADLKRHSAGDRDRSGRRAYIELAHETTRALHEFEKPVIAAINGPARGAGSELALCCDFVLMADGATLGFPETGLGTCVGGGVTRHLVAAVGRMRARLLLYTGRVITGAEAVRLGLALSCVPLDRLLPEALSLANELAEKAPVSLGLVKRLLNDASNLDLPGVLREETEAILRCMETDDWREGVAAFAEHRKPEYRGR